MQENYNMDAEHTHYMLNFDFEKEIRENENKLSQKYQNLINALQDVANRLEYKGDESQDLDDLYDKIDDAQKNQHEYLDVTDGQVSILSVATRYLKDEKFKDTIEDAINRVRQQPDR